LPSVIDEFDAGTIARPSGFVGHQYIEPERLRSLGKQETSRQAGVQNEAEAFQAELPE
jgi:hypothetical protein